MQCDPKADEHTEECIKGTNRCDGSLPVVICELCHGLATPGTRCVGDIYHDFVE